MSDLEHQLVSDLDAASVWQRVEEISAAKRWAGTAGERDAAEYVMAKLAGWGVPARLDRFESFVSHPLEAELEILAPERMTIRCRPKLFTPNTPDAGIEADLVWVPSRADRPDRGAMVFAQFGRPEDYAGVDVAGKIVITTGGGPDGVKDAQDHGAVAHCHIWPSGEDVIHEGQASLIWGAPTPETIGHLLKIPALSITKGDGERLQAMCRRGRVRARLRSSVFTGWRTVYQPVAEIPGRVEPEKYFLVAGHLCSWFAGTTDNATGMSCLLEMARLFHAHRARLRRGIRFVWWTSHEHGRYGGSVWYVDNHYADLRKNCVATQIIDSPGVRNATEWEFRYNNAEVEAFARQVAVDVSGSEPRVRRPYKAGDQSFWGLGLPSLGAYRVLSADSPDRAVVGGSGGGWWWHSVEDTVDKGDAKVLAGDTEMYLTIAARLCTAEALPLEFLTVAADFTRLLTELREAAGKHLDLGDVLAAAERFAAAARAIEAAKRTVSTDRVGVLNEGLMELSRIVNPMLYTVTGDYDQDLARQVPMLPGLERVRQLAALAPDSDDYRMVRTRMVRERNRVEDALVRATRAAERLVNELGHAR